MQLPKITLGTNRGPVVLALCAGVLFGFCFAYFLQRLEVPEGSPIFVHPPRNSYREDEADEADMLAERVKVLCWIMTGPNNHQKRAIHVKRTWGQRCNKLLFMSSKADPSLPSIALPNVTEGREYLWGKTKEAFQYVYAHHFEEADWFLKVDDDTYVVVENLRLLLKDYDPKLPYYFGCRLKPYLPQGYMSGGAGYVLSKEALRRLVVEAIPYPSKCGGRGGFEDVEMGKCMQNLGIKPEDTRDAFGRYRFLTNPPDYFLDPELKDNPFYINMIYYKQMKGMECCSETAITFHYVPPAQMYALDYLIYYLKPYGLKSSLRRNSTVNTFEQPLLHRNLGNKEASSNQL